MREIVFESFEGLFLALCLIFETTENPKIKNELLERKDLKNRKILSMANLPGSIECSVVSCWPDGLSKEDFSGKKFFYHR